MHRIALAAVAAAFCLSGPAFADSAPSSDTAPVADMAQTADAAQPAATTAPAKPEKPKKICRASSDVTGTRLGGARICLTQAEWDVRNGKTTSTLHQGAN